MNQDDIQNQVFKVGSLWAAVGIGSWTDAAAFLAAVYSLILLLEWAWKRIARPLLVRFGWMQPATVPAHITGGDDGE